MHLSQKVKSSTYYFCIKTKILTDFQICIKESTSRFDISNFVDRPLPIGKNKKVIRLMNVELGGQIMKKFVELRGNTYSYLKIIMMKIKKQKGQKIVS